MTDPGVPRTSVVLCSAGRSRWITEGVDSVLSQTDGDFELLVVVNRDAPPPELPADPRVRLVFGADGVGAAREAGLTAARGEFIAFCDDDDIWRPDHLTVLHAALEEAAADLVYGDSDLLTGDSAGPGWSRDVDLLELANSNYIFASDVLMRTEAARAAGGFDGSLTAYEDWDLWLRMSIGWRFQHVRHTLALRRWHEGALLADADWAQWQLVFKRHQDRVAALDLDGKLAVRPGDATHSRFRPETWTPHRKQLIWQSRLSPRYGYGIVAGHLLRAVQQRGVEVLLAPSGDQVPPEFSRVPHVDDHWGRIGFYYDLPGHPGALPVERVVSYFMWESACLPDVFVERINRWATLQLVPCRDNADAFRRSGVDVPIEVLRHGIDPECFPIIDRKPRDTFTFGTFSDLSPRKGVDVLVRAFSAEFGPDEPVRLLLKGTGKAASYAGGHPRIESSDAFLDDRGLRQWLATLDAFVLPSRGEGFGLTGLEAMATGLPLIATSWSGPAEYLHPADSYPLDYQLVDPGPRVSANVTYTGAWAEPDVDHLRQLLRHLVENPDEAREKGLAAARRVHAQWTWDQVAADLEDVLDRVARL